mgnify:FL=1
MQKSRQLAYGFRRVFQIGTAGAVAGVLLAGLAIAGVRAAQ